MSVWNHVEFNIEKKYRFSARKWAETYLSVMKEFKDGIIAIAEKLENVK